MFRVSSIMNNKELTSSHIFPLFLTSQTQKIFKCVIDQHVTEADTLKVIKKTDIINDLKNRAAISDFHPVKNIINKWTDDHLLLVYDHNFKHGQNFYLVTDKVMMNIMMNKSDDDDTKHPNEDHGQNQCQYTTERKKTEWKNYGSDREIKEGIVKERSKICVHLTRKRNEFGAPVEFTDGPDDTNNTICCKGYEDSTFILERKLLDKVIQSSPNMKDTSSQTAYPNPQNEGVQYYPRYNEESVNSVIMESTGMKDFFIKISPR